jgi:hypothetical protein
LQFCGFGLALRRAFPLILNVKLWIRTWIQPRSKTETLEFPTGMGAVKLSGIAKDNSALIETLKMVVAGLGSGLWLIYEPMYFGIETEEEYDRCRTRDYRGKECFSVSDSRLLSLLTSDAVGIDWTEFYFFRTATPFVEQRWTCADGWFRVVDATVWELAVDKEPLVKKLVATGFDGDGRLFNWKSRFPLCCEPRKGLSVRCA